MGSGASKKKGNSCASDLDDEMKVVPGRFYDTFELGKLLGKGNTANVRVCTHKTTKAVYAAKIIQSKHHWDAAHHEADIMGAIGTHPQVIGLTEYFDAPDAGGRVIMVLEHVPCGELFDRIVRKEVYTEQEAVLTLTALLSGLAYCHSMHVAHKDLKPENLLLSSETDDASIKLCDFGYASRIDPSSGLCLNKTKVGTPAYAAPELISSNIFGAKIDVWAAGVITYILLVGYPPFDHDLSVNEMYENIVNNNIDYEEDDWKGLSPLALEFVQTMLQGDQNARWTSTEMLAHPWLQNTDQSNYGQANVTALRSFNARRKLKAKVKMVIAMNKVSGQSRSVTDVAHALTLAIKGSGRSGSDMRRPSVQNAAFGQLGTQRRPSMAVRQSSQLKGVASEEQKEADNFKQQLSMDLSAPDDVPDDESDDEAANETRAAAAT